MNPRQRRGLILLILAGLGAIVVFIGIASYVSQVNAQVGPRTKVYIASHVIPPYAAVLPDDVATVELPTKYVTDAMIQREQDFLGLKAVSQIPQGSWLSREMLIPASSIADGQREISINFDPEQGINGRVQPGDKVDVVAAFAAAKNTSQVADPSVRRAQIPYNIAGIIVHDARVVSVGARTPVGVNVGDAREGNPNPAEVVPVTFSVSVAEATRLAYAESFSVSMRLMRAGNNETGGKIKPSDNAFSDLGLPGVLVPTGPPPARPSADAGGPAGTGAKKASPGPTRSTP